MRRWTLHAFSFLLATALAAPAGAGLRVGPHVAASGAEALRWGHLIDERVANGSLSFSRVQRDGHFPGRHHLRYDQRVGGLRVLGAQLVRQLDERDQTLSVFGHALDGIEVDTRPVLTADQAARAAEADRGRGARAVGVPELLILPLEDRTVLAYMLWTRVGFLLERYFVDARTGAVALHYDDTRTVGVVGTGTGVWGDRKKVSAEGTTGNFHADDQLRPPALTTFDMGFDLGAAEFFLGTGILPSSFIARDSDNVWTDGGVVDAHVYAGWTYDYYFRRQGRRGIDDADLPVRSITHFLPPPAGFANAFWDTLTSAMFYGDGDDTYGVFSGALDVVAHELTHGVTDYTWGGFYANESGALNEAFSDIMGTSVEFFQEPVGNDRKRADYFLGEDLSFAFNPPVFAIRAMENPGLFGDPDHYSRRFLGPQDNGGVHINSGIANQAYYLLIEGGTNRTSGINVAGLGSANRDRAEKIFYRGFTSFLTPSASFSDARTATIQAARELFGTSSNEAAQTAAAWTAVGVN